MGTVLIVTYKEECVWTKHRSCKHDNNVGRLYFYQHFYSIKSDSGYILLFIVYLSFSSLTLNVYESYLICSKVVSLGVTSK